MGSGPELLVHEYGLLCVIGAPIPPICDAELIVCVICRVQVDGGFQILNGVLHFSLFQQGLSQLIIGIGMVRLPTHYILK